MAKALTGKAAELEARLRLGAKLSPTFRLVSHPNLRAGHLMERVDANVGHFYRTLCNTARYTGAASLEWSYSTRSPICRQCLWRAAGDAEMLRRMLPE